MIEIPKEYKAAVLTTASPKSAIRFNSISDEDKEVVRVERRLAPTRRRAGGTKSQIERRVSSDRRRRSFSSKA